MTTPPNDGGPAFPIFTEDGAETGMSLRDWFAGQILAQAAHDYCSCLPEHAGASAKIAYQFADAMLKARNSPTP